MICIRNACTGHESARTNDLSKNLKENIPPSVFMNCSVWQNELLTTETSCPNEDRETQGQSQEWQLILIYMCPRNVKAIIITQKIFLSFDKVRCHLNNNTSWADHENKKTKTSERIEGNKKRHCHLAHCPLPWVNKIRMKLKWSLSTALHGQAWQRLASGVKMLWLSLNLEHKLHFLWDHRLGYQWQWLGHFYEWICICARMDMCQSLQMYSRPLFWI